MRSLRVLRAKPNPLGKDRYGAYTPPGQLAAEWIDFSNDGDQPFPLEGIHLNHVAYQPGCRDPEWAHAVSFSGTLQPGRVVRVHSGHRTALAPEDNAGADVHLFTGLNYIWNNACGDTVGLWNETAKTWEDRASYDPYPPEGQVLHREGDKLVP